MKIAHNILYFTFSLILMTLLTWSNLYSQSNSVIGLTVEFSAPGGPVEYADKIYLIKIDDDSEITEKESFIRSNFQIDNQIYFKDIDPGRYAIVAIGKQKMLPINGLTELTTYFSKALIKENIVTVGLNDFVYLGNYRVTTKMMVSNKKSDKSQVHYYQIITGKKRIPSYMRQVSIDTWYYRADLENVKIDIGDKSDFLMKALKHFQGMEQEDIIKRKMDKFNWPQPMV